MATPARAEPPGGCADVSALRCLTVTNSVRLLSAAHLSQQHRRHVFLCRHGRRGDSAISRSPSRCERIAISSWRAGAICRDGRDGFLCVENNVRETKQESQRELLPLTNLPAMRQRTISRGCGLLSRLTLVPLDHRPEEDMCVQCGQQSPGHPPLLMLTNAES